jgi:pimeloyl-ACP methyl ester carboxylesterase
MRQLNRILTSLLAVAVIGLTNTANAQSASIAETRFISLGGVEQWITIRGDNRNNPILLLLHGGPGAPDSSLTSTFAPFERNFVIVQWDQRGSGKTLQRAEGSPQQPSLDQLVQDGVELTEYLKTYLKSPNIILVGHSWGSFLGVHIVKRRPELFRAFIGTGQVVSWSSSVTAQYRYTLERVRHDGNAAAVSELETLGVPASDKLDQYLVLRKWLNRYMAPSDIDWIGRERTMVRAALSASEFEAYRQGFESMSGLASTVFSMNVPALGFEFKLPFFVIQGSDDQITPLALAREYVEQINAPIKRLDVIPSAGHSALMTHTAQFIEILTQDLHRIP